MLKKKIEFDHVHLVLSIPPKYSIAEVVVFLKEKSTIKMFDCHIHLKKQYWDRHFCSKGYCVSNIGLNEKKIRRYVKWQIEKDKRIEQENLWK